MDNGQFEELSNWLVDRPFEWGPALAVRGIIRTLPSALDGISRNSWRDGSLNNFFRGLFVAWTTVNSPIKSHKKAAVDVYGALYNAAMSSEREAFVASALRYVNEAIGEKAKHDKVLKSVRSLIAVDNYAKTTPSPSVHAEIVSQGIRFDVKALSSLGERNLAARSLLNRPFVESGMDLWKEELEISLECLDKRDTGLKIWTSWIRDMTQSGREEFSFSRTLPNLTDRLISTKIIQKIDDVFWQSSPEQVSDEVKKWIQEAAIELPPSKPPLVPAQNPNFIQFQRSDDGKIYVNEDKNIRGLRKDEDARDRHKECVDIAKMVADRCLASNSAQRLSEILRRYIESAGDSIEELRPSLFVQRGERLRQEIQAYSSADSLLPPVPDDILLDLVALRAAHNMAVGLDPYLMARDTAQLGPDAQPTAIPPQEIRDLALEADAAGILGDAVAEVVIEAADLAPDVADSQDRRTVWSVETGRNLVIEAFNVAMGHPGKSVAGAAVVGSVVATATLPVTILTVAGGTLPAARFLLKHKEWIEVRLGQTPTWRGLFLDLCDWIEKNTPVE